MKKKKIHPMRSRCLKTKNLELKDPKMFYRPETLFIKYTVNHLHIIHLRYC